ARLRDDERVGADVEHADVGVERLHRDRHRDRDVQGRDANHDGDVPRAGRVTDGVAGIDPGRWRDHEDDDGDRDRRRKPAERYHRQLQHLGSDALGGLRRQQRQWPGDGHAARDDGEQVDDHAERDGELRRTERAALGHADWHHHRRADRAEHGFRQRHQPRVLDPAVRRVQQRRARATAQRRHAAGAERRHALNVGDSLADGSRVVAKLAAGGGTSVTDSGLTAGATYYYRAFSYFISGSLYSAAGASVDAPGTGANQPRWVYTSSTAGMADPTVDGM